MRLLLEPLHGHVNYSNQFIIIVSMRSISSSLCRRINSFRLHNHEMTLHALSPSLSTGAKFFVAEPATVNFYFYIIYKFPFIFRKCESENFSKLLTMAYARRKHAKVC